MRLFSLIYQQHTFFRFVNLSYLKQNHIAKPNLTKQNYQS